MKKTLFKTLLSLSLTILVLSCDEDDSNPMPNAGSIAGGPFSFVVDGQTDNVSGISTDGTAVGTNAGWVITDDQNNILGLPPTIPDLENVDFDGAGEGICFIWYIRYENGLEGLESGQNVSGLDGLYDLSNAIQVTRSALGGATIAGGPFTFIVDGTEDFATGISVDDSNVNGMNTTFVITDNQNNILGLPPTLDALGGVNFDGAGGGVCFIWHLTYADNLSGLEAGNSTTDLTGNYVLSNSIMVTRASAGELTGGPFNFTVDGMADNVSGISVANNQDLSNAGYVITDNMNNILGLPPTMDALQGVNFDAAGAGECYIYRITYEDGITGLEAGQNTSDLDGSLFSLSNRLTVTRN